MESKIISSASILLLTLLTISLVSAAGVSSPYWEGNPLEMAKGETTTVDLNVQNMVGEDNLEFTIELVSGGEIAVLKTTSVSVDAGTKDTVVPVEISIARDAVTGETTVVRVEFKTVGTDEEGMITVGTGMNIEFDVIVTEETVQRNYTTIIALGILALLAAITYLIYKKKK